MADIPGNVGWTLLSDKSLDFKSSPLEFVEKNIEVNKSRIFAGRLLNKATIFVCSNKGVREILEDEDDTFEFGYKTIMEDVYLDNIFFTDGDEARLLRDALAHLFSPLALESYQSTIQRIAKDHVAKIDPSKPLPLYHFFKQVATEICLTLFLGIDFSQSEEAASIVYHTLRHWHGLVSMPVSVKVPGTSLESSFKKAIVAKKEILRVIQNQRGMAPEGFVRRMQMLASEEDDEFIENHLLLFSCALVPKAIASLLTSFFIELGKKSMISLQPQVLENQQLRTHMFQEVQRLFPPFLGGRRLARKDVVIDGFKIPADYAVVLMTRAAHRDPAVFSHPDTFMYERWSDGRISDENLFGFGLGPRICPAQQLVWNIINETVTQFMCKYNWHLAEETDFSYKYLPVSRPTGSILVKLTPAKTRQDINPPDPAAGVTFASTSRSSGPS